MKKQNEKPQARYKWLKYTGLGFQMMAIIGIGAVVGTKLDKRLNTDQPYFTAGFTLVFVIIAIYIGIKDLLQSE